MNIKSGLSMYSLPLIALMALTRFHHFGDAFSLPDASLAVFFLAGFAFARQWQLLILLLIEAVLIDYIAIAHFNVSAFCISSAYIFLLLAYGLMWFAGCYCAKYQNLKLNDMALTVLIMGLVTSLAFFISNTSFYVLSGRPATLSWAQYTDTFMQYYSAYLSTTLCYGVLSVIIIKVFKILPVLTTKHRAV